jgi:hypothetical protein
VHRAVNDAASTDRGPAGRCPASGRLRRQTLAPGMPSSGL